MPRSRGTIDWTSGASSEPCSKSGASLLRMAADSTRPSLRPRPFVARRNQQAPSNPPRKQRLRTPPGPDQERQVCVRARIRRRQSARHGCRPAWNQHRRRCPRPPFRPNQTGQLRPVGRSVFVDNREIRLRLNNLKRKREIGGARHTRQITFDLRIQRHRLAKFSFFFSAAHDWYGISFPSTMPRPPRMAPIVPS